MKIDVNKLPGPTSRVERIRKRFVEITPQLCVDRASLITESYKETENEPIHIRRAKALEKILTGMTISIADEELIVGNHGSKMRAAPVFPDFSYKWLDAELDAIENRPNDKFLISEENKRKLHEDIFPYWNGKTTSDLASSLMTQEAKDARDASIFNPDNYFFSGIGHIGVDYAKVLQKGLNGIMVEAEEAIGKLDIANPDDLSKMHFLRAVIIANKAAIRFAERFAEEADRLAVKEKNAERKAELKEIARICRKVPANPAESFWEAVQSFWFIHCILHIESNGHSVSMLRFDQYMYPYFKMDGDITLEKAQELLDLLYIKFATSTKVFDRVTSRFFAGYLIAENLTVGGVNRDGEDATNELSYMCLQSLANTKLFMPSAALRVHSMTPDSLFLKALEVARLGLGMPAFYNDKTIIPALLNRGLTLEDARDYGIEGCVEPQVAGKTQGWHDIAYFNLPKVLELALNNGYCPVSKKQLGPKTGDIASFKTFDDVMNAYKKQVEHFVKLLINVGNSIDIAHRQRTPLPFLSSFVSDCITKGKCVQEGGARYNFSGPQGVGVANVANSLAAIKKLIFEEKTISMAELKEALDSNFEGKEDLRQMLLNRVPKYGNDDEYVDQLAHDAALVYCKEVEKYSNPRGGRYQPGLYPVAIGVLLGEAVGATPDGRKAYTPLAEGVSPTQGTDKMGPTAVVRSVARLDHVIASNGTLLNQKFHPSVLKDERGLRNLMGVIRTLFTDNKGGHHIQFNVVSREKLLDAQQNPDKYRDMVVRVAGYSAFFTALDKKVQDDIISRTEQIAF